MLGARAGDSLRAAFALSGRRSLQKCRADIKKDVNYFIENGVQKLLLQLRSGQKKLLK